MYSVLILKLENGKTKVLIDSSPITLDKLVKIYENNNFEILGSYKVDRLTIDA